MLQTVQGRRENEGLAVCSCNKPIFDYRADLVGDGGMPSGHSATVASLTTAALLCYGPGSFQFAISLILAIVVCKDAMGVRLETGKQAVMLNEMMRVFNVLTSSEQLPEVKLKEFVGHTPIQVMAGILLGIANAVVMYELVL